MAIEMYIRLTDKVVAGYLDAFFKKSLGAQYKSPIWSVLKRAGVLKYRSRGKNIKDVLADKGIKPGFNKVVEQIKKQLTGDCNPGGEQIPGGCLPGC